MATKEFVPKEPVTVEPETGEKPVVKVESPQLSYEKEKRIILHKRILWYGLTVLEFLLAFRFLLKLFGANPYNLFSILIQIATIPFLFIFINLFPSALSLTGNLVLEWSTLFAMFFYAAVAFLISRFYKIRKPIDPEEADKKVEDINP